MSESAAAAAAEEQPARSEVWVSGSGNRARLRVDYDEQGMTRVSRESLTKLLERAGFTREEV
jgi:hypothetical protein